MVFSCDGLYLISPDFKIGKLNQSIQGSNYNDNIAHFLLKDGGYIIYIVNNNHFLFSSEGNFLQTFTSTGILRKFYNFAIVPYKHSQNNFYYFYIYHNTTKIIFDEYIYYSNQNQISYNKYYFYNLNIEQNNNYDFITCELMKNEDNNDAITCFLAYLDKNFNICYIDCFVFDSNLKYNKTSRTKTTIITKINNIKSSLMTIEGRKKVLIVAQILNCNNENSIFYAGYDITTNSFKEGIINNKANCTMDVGYINNYFFIETEQFVVSYLSICKSFPQNDNKEPNYIIYLFDKNFNYFFFGTIRSFIFAPFKENNNNICSPIIIYSNNLHTILFSSYTQSYCFIGNIINDKVLSSIIINKEIKIINPIEKKSDNNQLYVYKCENFTDFNPKSDYFKFLKDSSMNYLPKCSNDLTLISNCSNIIENQKTFKFSFNCSEKFPYELIKENKCVDFCDNISLSNGTCKLDYYKDIEIKESTFTYENTYDIKSEDTKIVLSSTSDIIYDKIDNLLNGNIYNDKTNIIEDIKDLFSSGEFNDQLDNIVNGEKDIIVNNKDILIQITTTDNQKKNENHNISSIDLGECETILKNEYKINQNTSLLILKIDSFIEDSKIPVIQYEVYHPINKNKLDLSFCDNSKIEINIPVSINESSLYKYEPKSDYYNDRCFTFTSDNGTDIPLNNRREEFNNKNMSLCEANCEYLGYNKEIKNSKCECDVKNEISILNIEIDSDQ